MIWGYHYFWKQPYRNQKMLLDDLFLFPYNQLKGGVESKLLGERYRTFANQRWKAGYHVSSNQRIASWDGRTPKQPNLNHQIYTSEESRSAPNAKTFKRWRSDLLGKKKLLQVQGLNKDLMFGEDDDHPVPCKLESLVNKNIESIPTLIWKNG